MADTVDSSIAEHLPDNCPQCFSALQGEGSWWQARPAGSRLLGVVVAREGMPSVVRQREQLTRFGVQIEGFRHPAPETHESWEQRLARLFEHVKRNDVVVVVDVRALGRDVHEESRTLAELRARGVMVKVLSHDGTHLGDVTR